MLSRVGKGNSVKVTPHGKTELSIFACITSKNTFAWPARVGVSRLELWCAISLIFAAPSQPPPQLSALKLLILYANHNLLFQSPSSRNAVLIGNSCSGHFNLNHLKRKFRYKTRNSNNLGHVGSYFGHFGFT